MTNPLPPGSKIGILGGGQLGRMLSVAASRLGFECHIYEPGASPAAQVAAKHVQSGYDDIAALEAFARDVDVITYEFENIPTAALDCLAALAPIHPDRRALEVSQDRITEKEFLNDEGLKTAPFWDLSDDDDLATIQRDASFPAILKTRRFGYDGKGQVRVEAAEEVADAWAELGRTPCVLEGFVDFSIEISAIVARGQDGQIAVYDPGHNRHEDGILRETTVPAPIPASRRSDAVLAAAKIANALDYVGVMGVEFFVTKAGLIINEIAPRVHNSGHWTQNGCDICQFEQHIRAIAGWPLGDGKRHSDIRMENLIGDDMDRLAELAGSGTAIHLYGKSEARAGRKMGHVNFRL